MKTKVKSEPKLGMMLAVKRDIETGEKLTLLTETKFLGLGSDAVKLIRERLKKSGDSITFERV